MIMKKNILVVDDSALMRRVICDIINSDDTFQVTDVCRDGLEAYEKLKVNRYDGVILDVNMPRMGGLELLERLQKERIKTNVIMVSTMTTRDADVTILAMERGAVDFVTKPTNIIEAKANGFTFRLIYCRCFYYPIFSKPTRSCFQTHTELIKPLIIIRLLSRHKCSNESIFIYTASIIVYIDTNNLSISVHFKMNTDSKFIVLFQRL